MERAGLMSQQTPVVRLRAPAAWWLVVPSGYDELVFSAQPRVGGCVAPGGAGSGDGDCGDSGKSDGWAMVRWRRVRWWRWLLCAGGRCDVRQTPGLVLAGGGNPGTRDDGEAAGRCVDVRVSRQPACTGQALSVASNVFWSFILAFLTHLVPSIIWGAASSLGSPRNHGRMGIVWFSLWPVYCAIMVLARPRGLIVTDDAGRDHFVQMTLATGDLAERVAAFWMQPHHLGKGETGTVQMPRMWRPVTVVGTLVFIALLANAFYTGAAVVACMGRGCCRDNATTLPSCVATGYPQ